MRQRHFPRAAAFVAAGVLVLSAWVPASANDTVQGAGTAAHTGNSTARRHTVWRTKDSNDTEFDSTDTETVQQISAKVIQPISAALMGIMLLAAMLERLGISWIPESVVIIAAGAICGLALRHWELMSVHALLEVNAPIVNLACLPIIIFESGFSLRQKDFVAQFPHILIFAVLGTIVSMGIVGGLIYATGDLHGVRDLRTAFTFASLIAATDPVATLSTYSSLSVDPLLHILVFGESTINDAVAIVVFGVMNSEEVWGPSWATDVPPVSEVWSAVLCGIAQKLSGSIFIGVGLGILYTLALKCGDMRHAHSLEILFILISCYLTFATAECAGMSGIIAALFCGIFMGIYAKPHLSGQGSVLAEFFLKQVATIGDMTVFLLVGIDIILVNSASVCFSLWLMLFCLVSRGVAVGLCGVLSNSLKSAMAGKRKVDLPLTWRHLLMMWHAGLRGGIALVLCLEMGDWVDTRGDPGTKQELINATIVVIAVFLIVFGGTTEMSLKALGIPTGMKVDEGYLYDRSLITCAQRCLHSLHHRWLAPVLFPHDSEALQAMQCETVEPLRKVMSDYLQRSRGHYWFRGRAAAEYSSSEDSEFD